MICQVLCGLSHVKTSQHIIRVQFILQMGIAALGSYLTPSHPQSQHLNLHLCTNSLHLTFLRVDSKPPYSLSGAPSAHFREEFWGNTFKPLSEEEKQSWH